MLGHGQEEYSDRIYLMIEGVEGKVHFLYQTDESRMHDSKDSRA